MPPRQQVKVNEEDVIHTMKDGIGSVNFLDRVQQQMKEAMGFSVVVSPLGKIVRYHALLNRLYAIFRPQGSQRQVGKGIEAFVEGVSDWANHRIITCPIFALSLVTQIFGIASKSELDPQLSY